MEFSFVVGIFFFGFTIGYFLRKFIEDGEKKERSERSPDDHTSTGED